MLAVSHQIDKVYLRVPMVRITDAIKRTPPGLTLLLLAPVLGELVSVHQTPLEFVNPLNFIICHCLMALEHSYAASWWFGGRKGGLACCSLEWLMVSMKRRSSFTLFLIPTGQNLVLWRTMVSLRGSIGPGVRSQFTFTLSSALLPVLY